MSSFIQRVVLNKQVFLLTECLYDFTYTKEKKRALTFWNWRSVMNSQVFLIWYNSSSFSRGVFVFTVTSTTRWITVSELLLNASAIIA